MHRRAVNFHARLQSARMRVETLEGWQQGRVDIEQAVLPLADKPGRQQPHEAGKADKFDSMTFQHRLQRALEGGALQTEGSAIDDLGDDTGRARRAKSGGARLIGDDQRDFGRVVFRFGGLD